MTSLSHDFRQFWGLTKYMAESGYDNGRGEGEISQVLDISHPFSTTMINKRLLEPAEDMWAKSWYHVSFKWYECLCSPAIMVACSRQEEKKRSCDAVFRGKRSEEIQFYLDISLLFQPLDVLAHVLAPFLNLTICNSSQFQCYGQLQQGQQEKLNSAVTMSLLVTCQPQLRWWHDLTLVFGGNFLKMKTMILPLKDNYLHSCGVFVCLVGFCFFLSLLCGLSCCTVM